MLLLGANMFSNNDKNPNTAAKSRIASKYEEKYKRLKRLVKETIFVSLPSSQAVYFLMDSYKELKVRLMVCN